MFFRFQRDLTCNECRIGDVHVQPLAFGGVGVGTAQGIPYPSAFNSGFQQQMPMGVGVTQQQPLQQPFAFPQQQPIQQQQQPFAMGAGAFPQQQQPQQMMQMPQLMQQQQQPIGQQGLQLPAIGQTQLGAGLPNVQMPQMPTIGGF